MNELYATDWRRGPIGAGWFMMFAPVDRIRASGGGAGGGYFSILPKEKKKKPKTHYQEDEAIALFLLMRGQQ